MSLRVAMLSVHTCPLAALGGKETGGMNVYVRELARELSRMGAAVDVFTRSQNPAIPRVVRLAEHARVIHLPAGPQAPMRASASTRTSTSSWMASRRGVSPTASSTTWCTATTGSPAWWGWRCAPAGACRWCRCSTRSVR